jgi:hypothetical protein
MLFQRCLGHDTLSASNGARSGVAIRYLTKVLCTKPGSLAGLFRSNFTDRPNRVARRACYNGQTEHGGHNGASHQNRAVPRMVRHLLRRYGAFHLRPLRVRI